MLAIVTHSPKPQEPENRLLLSFKKFLHGPVAFARCDVEDENVGKHASSNVLRSEDIEIASNCLFSLRISRAGPNAGEPCVARLGCMLRKTESPPSC
ncbi:hypothetical protein SDC9_12486 [bioreactor metagenome]|uniref:Uncharacterized protein n=1 Tax=bioreactor metagenome TaxID=1076179 RepID=A0A644TIN3_9ZZZZ